MMVGVIPLKKIVIATNNVHKVVEFKKMLEPLGYSVYTLRDFPTLPDIVEDGTTFEANALKKAQVLSEYLKQDVIADDSGLMVEALNGAPGVYSARYAGEGVTYADNNLFLLRNMEGITHRDAQFITTMCFYQQGKEPHFFVGTLNGTIATMLKGDNGFGYDPLFVLPDGRHLAELELEEKNRISHRGKSLNKLIAYLKKQ
jgi:XTP/dITP diphosphohydrolase